MKTFATLPIIVAVSLGLLSSVAFAAGDPVKGKRVAKKCTACHTMNEGGKKRLGPNLYGIVDQPAGAIAGYRYSKAMKASGVIWTEAALTGFIAKPKKFLKGTKMKFGGIKSAKQRADLVAYLKSLGKGAPASPKE